jgi:hypothetical protein
MSKVQLSAALVLVAMFGLPVAAQAATSATVAPSAFSLHAENGDDGGDHGGDKNGDDGGSYTPSDVTPANPQDQDDSFVVPPVVIHPDGKRSHQFDKGPGSVPPIDGTPQTLSDIPGNHPIQVDKVHPSTKTPTDLFVDTAVIGLGAVGAGALGLGAVVGVRAIRARRSGVKADYFYGD